MGHFVVKSNTRVEKDDASICAMLVKMVQL